VKLPEFLGSIDKIRVEGAADAQPPTEPDPSPEPEDPAESEDDKKN